MIDWCKNPISSIINHKSFHYSEEGENVQEDNSYSSRKRRYEKRRVNTKMINWLAVVGVVLLLSIISLSIFGQNDDSEKAAVDNEKEETETPNELEEEETIGEENNENLDIPIVIEEVEDESGEAENTSDAEQAISYIETGDSNVKSAYEGNWQPVGTEQTGPHTIQFDDGSIDRKEMALAAEYATQVPVEEQITWWVGRAGDAQVEMTISPNSNQDELYRVHLQWIDNEGWQPTLVEELIENDTPSAQRENENAEAENIEG